MAGVATLLAAVLLPATLEPPGILPETLVAAVVFDDAVGTMTSLTGDVNESTTPLRSRRSVMLLVVVLLLLLLSTGGEACL